MPDEQRPQRLSKQVEAPLGEGVSLIVHVLFPRLIARVGSRPWGSDVCSRLAVCECHALTNWVWGHERCFYLPGFFHSH